MRSYLDNVSQRGLARVAPVFGSVVELNIKPGVQFHGYRDEKGVAKDSPTETFAALKRRCPETAPCSRPKTTSKKHGRIVEPVLKKNTPVYQYAPNTWARRRPSVSFHPEAGATRSKEGILGRK